MNKSTDRQFQAADAAVEQAVITLMSKTKSLFGKWGAVAPAYIVERLLLTLCREMTQLIDHPDFANHAGPETLKLSNALADYRDSRPVDRTGYFGRN